MVSLLTVAAFATLSALNYPLDLHTKWTYRLHLETGNGARTAKGNVLDATVTSEVAGSDIIGGQKYSRVESRRGRDPMLTEWVRVGPQGFMVGKTIEYGDQGQDVNVMQPPQRRLSQALGIGEQWTWREASGAMVMRYQVMGQEALDLPAGHFQATRVSMNGTAKQPFGELQLEQELWFVPGTGVIRTLNKIKLGGQEVMHSDLKLEKFQKP